MVVLRFGDEVALPAHVSPLCLLYFDNQMSWVINLLAFGDFQTVWRWTCDEANSRI